MRVNDLSKELGKNNKEVLALLNQLGADIKSHFSNISVEQEKAVRNYYSKELARPEKKSERSIQPKMENTTEPVNKEASVTDTVSEAKKQEEEPKKKKLTAVFRPQNAQQPRRPRAKVDPSQTGRIISVAQKDNVRAEAADTPVQSVGNTEQRSQTAVKPEENLKTEVKAAGKEQPAANVSVKEEKKVSADTLQQAAKEKESEPGRPVPGQTDTIPQNDQKTAAPLPAADKDSAQNRTAAAQIKTPQSAAAETAGRPQEKKNDAAPSAERHPETGKTAEPVKKAPLVEGRDKVTTFGNIFDFKRPEKKPEKKPENQQAGGQGRNVNRDGRRDGQPGGNRQPGSFRPGTRPGQDRKPGAQGTTGERADGRKPISQNERRLQKDQPGSRDNRPAAGKPQPGQRADGKTPISSQDTPFAKKNNNQKQNRNNFKDKNDKRHRTEDGPVKGTGKVSKHPFIKPETVKKETPVDDIKEIVIPETINIKDLAAKMKLQPAVIVKKLFMKGQIVNVNTELSFEQAEEIAVDFDIICTMEEKVDVIAELLKETEDEEETLVSRPPVVCVMGHVDHGKTSLLDKVRQTNVTSHEAGGITQAIGAYQVRINGRDITFLDTPGHEAFTAMRMRGAQSTDIAVLVVAADDGVMPQTVEAINHAKAADVEIIVAINKIDKPAANIDRVKQELAEHQLIPEDWGGSTIFCPVSAKTGEGIENLLEMILLAADVKELKANPNRLARGLVIEAELDKGRGPVATVLVQKGTLHVGDFVAAGACSGKVRAMINDKGQRVKTALPSTPVEILGLSDVPNAGEVFVGCESDKEAKDFAATFVAEGKNKLIEETKGKMSLDDLFSQIKAGNVKDLPIIVKADVQGSVEAVKQSLTKLSNEEIQVKVIHSGVGAINESDVALASASNAIIIGFNVKPDPTAKSTAEHEKVDVRLYSVIYNAIEDVENAMKGMLEPVYEEKVIGHAEIRQVFKASGVGSIAGSYVLDGIFQRGCKARITRDGEQIFDGGVASLKRFKDDVKEVRAGYECGLVFDGFNNIQEGDQIEGYAMVEVPRT